MDLEGNGHGLVWDTILALTWRDWSRKDHSTEFNIPSYSLTSQVLGQRWRSLELNYQESDNAVLIQDYHTLQGAVIDECRVMVEWLWALENWTVFDERLLQQHLEMMTL